MASSSTDEQPPPPPPQPPSQIEAPSKECLHRTKSIRFFGRPTPIVLQNDNGPCPLLGICNVLSLRNQLNLSADVSEVSQEKLLSLVAERLIDSNSNVDNKDAEYVQNQQQNIADAIDLLPRLTTGIDVNIKFCRIGDFEFTRECTIFDLLDIPLYHGWLVDPQDFETANAIGSKSYNAITRELVALQESEGKAKHAPDGDCIDFVAATTATLGVPSPSLSRAKSLDDSPRAASATPDVRKGDAEEAADLLRVLKLSENESSLEGSEAGPSGENGSVSSSKDLNQMQVTPTSFTDNIQEHNPSRKLDTKSSESGGNEFSCNNSDDLISLGSRADQGDQIFSKLLVVSPSDQLSFTQPEGGSLTNDLTKDASGALSQNETSSSPLLGIDTESLLDGGFQIQSSTPFFLKETPSVSETLDSASTMLDVHLQIGSAPDSSLSENDKAYKESGTEHSTALSADSDLSGDNLQKIEATESITSSLNDSEPLYEGEECILDSVTTICEDREPMYEGEVVLAKQIHGSMSDVHDPHSKDGITTQEGELISNFLNNNSNQLTFYGLFSLQEGLKERELCVFFRNNHFSTMFKFNGELYILITDQGYMNESGLVWEKLDEVSGDSVFYDCDFKEFRPENDAPGTWDVRNAVESTTDFMARMGNSGHDDLSMNSDLQLAMALQKQEFEQQQQQPQRRAPQPQGPQPQPPSTIGGSRLITGPQTSRPAARASSPSPRQDKKSKDGCSIM